jgi:hypothetical protein
MTVAKCRRNGYETQIIEGRWQQAGAVYRDNLVRIVVDVPEK